MKSINEDSNETKEKIFRLINIRGNAKAGIAQANESSLVSWQRRMISVLIKTSGNGHPFVRS